MKTQTRKIQTKIPQLDLQGRFLAETVNVESRTVEMVFTTSAAVRMWRWKGWDIEEFNEILSMADGHIRLERMKKGAPLLDSHNRYGGINAQIGVVEDVWTEGEQLVGRVRFPKAEDDPETDKIFRKVKDGIIRNGSIGYRVHHYKDETKEDDKIKTLRAVDWEPVEMSLVSIPADASAQVRAANQEEFECEIEIENTNERNLIMKTPPSEKTTQETQSPNQVELDKVRQAEKDRNQKITRACRQAKLPSTYSEELIASEKSLEECLMDIQAKWAESDKETPIRSASSTEVSFGAQNEADTRREGAAEAILHRIAPQEHKITEKGAKYRGRTAMELVRMVLEANGVRTEMRNQDDLIHRAFHSTSDFTAILENVASKRLQKAYESVPQIFKLFAEETTLRDFKVQSVAHLGEAPALEKLGEGGEIKTGTMGDSKEVWKLATYAKGLPVTRELLINDDLGAFAKVAAAFGRAAAILENKVALKEAFLNNPDMGDEVAIFDSAHANLDGTDAFVSEATISRLKAMMKKQTDDKGNPLELDARWLMVGPDSESAARKILAAQSKEGGFNVHGNEFGLIVTAAITDYSHYLIADKSKIEGLVYGYLEGAQGIQMRTIVDPNVLGVTIQAYMDFAAKAINWRAFAKNEGGAPA